MVELQTPQGWVDSRHRFLRSTIDKDSKLATGHTWYGFRESGERIEQRASLYKHKARRSNVEGFANKELFMSFFKTAPLMVEGFFKPIHLFTQSVTIGDHSFNIGLVVGTLALLRFGQDIFRRKRLIDFATRIH